MILDFKRFAESSSPRWQRLESYLNRLEADPLHEPSIAEIEEIHSLYQHACADLARVAPLAAEPELKRYLDWLVSRAYSEIHQSRARPVFSLKRWFLETLPSTFRRHLRAFQLSAALTVLGALFGALALAIDPEAKAILMPFPHLQDTPRERVAKEMAKGGADLEGNKNRFSAMLMTHNTRVILFTLALGATFAIGTALLLFYNGVILGAVVFDYVAGGQTIFLLGWLLPHGAVEIPAILIGGQTGLVLGHALIGWGDRTPRDQRVRAVAPDLVTLAAGAALLLVWAGIVEAFFSQYHEPVVPFAVKIAFGLIELALLYAYLTSRRAGTSKP
jgi:uncharacterized membrane protein SpoIIM required for sporulation